MATKKTAAKAPTKTAAKKSSPAKTAVKAPATKTAAPKSSATRQQIAELAHKYFAERGHSHGSHVDDWLRAEKKLNG